MNGFKLAMCGVLLAASSATADDLVLSPSPPVVQRMTYYGPPTIVSQAAPVYAAPAPTTSYYAPAAPAYTSAPAPVTTYYAPAPAYAPAPVTTYYAPAPVTTYYAPAVTARPVISYYGPTAVPVTSYYAPAAALPMTTYYAPAAVPVAVAPYGVVRTKVYYPGMPVRNFFKSITP